MMKKMGMALIMITALVGAAFAQEGPWGVSAGVEMNMNSGNHVDYHEKAAL